MRGNDTRGCASYVDGQRDDSYSWKHPIGTTLNPLRLDWPMILMLFDIWHLDLSYSGIKAAVFVVLPPNV